MMLHVILWFDREENFIIYVTVMCTYIYVHKILLMELLIYEHGNIYGLKRFAIYLNKSTCNIENLFK